MTDSTIRRPDPKQKKNHPSPVLYRWGAALFWLAVWQLCALAMAQPLLLPSPVAVAARLGALAITADFWVVVAGSMARILTGYLLGLALGVLLAVGTSLSPLARVVVALPMGIIKATPVVSFAILALLFVRGGWFSVVIALLMVLPLVWGATDTAIAATDRQLLQMAQAYRFGRSRTVRYIYLPSVLPHLAAAARTALGFAWKAGVAGEVIGTPKGAIGTQLYNAKVYLETTDLFAWTVTVILLSLLLERGVTLLLSRLRGGARR